MGCWDAPCIICGAPPNRDASSWEEQNKRMPATFNKLTNWLFHCTILLPDGQILHNYEEKSCNADFGPRNKKGKNIAGLPGIEESLLLNGELVPFGMWLHDDCWNYIKKYLGVELSYKYLPEHIWEYNGKLEGVNYGYIEEYHDGQFLNTYEICQNKDEWLLTSPLLNSKNAAKNKIRINRVLSQLKLTKSEVKIRKNRPSPPISATLVDNNALCLGQHTLPSQTKGVRNTNNDDKVWKKVGGKWKLQNNFTKIEVELDYNSFKPTYAPNKNIILREQTSYEKNPVFILNYKLIRKGNKLNKGKLELLSTDAGYDQLFKYFKKYNVGYKVKQ